jgi:hypothetical protein
MATISLTTHDPQNRLSAFPWGSRLEVRLGGSQGAFHLGNGPAPGDSSMAWVEAANFNSYYYYDGERYTLGGWNWRCCRTSAGAGARPVTLTDVVNPWDDRVGARYRVGWDGDETLTGDALDDRLEGRGGNDVLNGLGGRDRRTGGNGNDQLDGVAPTLDTATWALARSSYTVSRSGGTVQSVQALSGSEGRDEVVLVERLQFADRSVAFDLDGNAGTGRAADGRGVRCRRGTQPGYAGIGTALPGRRHARDVDLARAGGRRAAGCRRQRGRRRDTLYFNLVGVRCPTADALKVFTDLLDNGTYDRGSLTLAAAMTDLQAQRIDLVGLASVGLDYVPV